MCGTTDAAHYANYAFSTDLRPGQNRDGRLQPKDLKMSLQQKIGEQILDLRVWQQMHTTPLRVELKKLWKSCFIFLFLPIMCNFVSFYHEKDKGVSAFNFVWGLNSLAPQTLSRHWSRLVWTYQTLSIMLYYTYSFYKPSTALWNKIFFRHFLCTNSNKKAFVIS